MGGPRTVEHWGTFELANYGDLLYPLILEHHLASHLDDVAVRLAGPLGGTVPMGDGRPVRRAVPLAERGFWEQAAGIDAFVLGGGDLLHTWTSVVSVDDVAARLDPWAFAGEAGLLAEVRPFVWNGLGVPYDLDDDHAALLRTGCQHVDLLAVRDDASKARLERARIEHDIVVVPDTAYLVTDVIGSKDRAACIDKLRADGTLPPGSSPFVAVHTSFTLPGAARELAGALTEVRHRFPDLEVVLLEMGRTHGDLAGLRALQELLGPRTWLLAEPTVQQVTSVIGAAAAVVSSSFHAALVASTLGVRSISFMQENFQPAKLIDLARQLGREEWILDRPSVVATALEAALNGAGAPGATRVAALQRAARAHLEHVAEVVERGARTGVHLSERTAAHAHLLDRLAQLRALERRAAAERLLLTEQVHHARSTARLWEAAFWREQRHASAEVDPPARILGISKIDAIELEEDPFRWGLVGPLFDPSTAVHLARKFPLDEAEHREGNDGRRSWRYQVRCLLPMGRATPVRPQALDPRWRQLADELAGPAYRTALSRLTGVELDPLDLEANLFSYGPGAFQEAHPDLPEKVVTHVLWFNEDWEEDFGGCLRILRSSDPEDVARELLPSLGWSALFVRSASSWHSVTPVSDAAPADRRALVVTFHRPGSLSSMWGGVPD